MNKSVLAFLLITTFVSFCFDLVSCSAIKKVTDADIENFIIPYPKDFYKKHPYMLVDETLEDNATVHYEKIIKLKISLYLEALCLGCRGFIKDQLYVTYMKIPKFIEIDLIPYGNAKHFRDSNGKLNFTCQHAEPECIGNLYLACVTHYLQEKRPKQMLQYYNCMSNALTFQIEEDVKECANVSYVNYDSLETCVKTEGPEILAHYGERTHALKGRKYVPTVVVDDKLKYDDHDQMELDLFRYLCKKFKGRKPRDCALMPKTDSLEEKMNPFSVYRCDIKAPQVDYYRPDPHDEEE